jgi:hypothetical protein
MIFSPSKISKCQNSNSYNGMSKEKGRPCKRWRDEVEEDLNVM